MKNEHDANLELSRGAHSQRWSSFERERLRRKPLGVLPPAALAVAIGVGLALLLFYGLSH